MIKLGRRDSPVPDCVSQTTDDARQTECSPRRSTRISKNRNEKSTELVVQGNVYWLRAKMLNDGVDSELLRAMDDVEMRALENRVERLGPMHDFNFNGGDGCTRGVAGCRDSWAMIAIADVSNIAQLVARHVQQKTRQTAARHEKPHNTQFTNGSKIMRGSFCPMTTQVSYGDFAFACFGVLYVCVCCL